MPLKPLPYRQVRRKLLAAGFQEVGQEGGHVKFARQTDEGTRTAIVPPGNHCWNDSLHSPAGRSGTGGMGCVIT